MSILCSLHCTVIVATFSSQNSIPPSHSIPIHVLVLCHQPTLLRHLRLNLNKLLSSSLISGKKQSCPEPNINFGIINEICIMICIETFNMIKQKLMTVANQYIHCDKHYLGEKKIMGQVENFLKSISNYKYIWTVEQGKMVGWIASTVWLVHCCWWQHILAACLVNICHKECSTNRPNNCSNAKETMRETKMHSLLPLAKTEKVLEAPVNGKYRFPSGKSEDNFNHSMLHKMFN